ncbi:phosphatase, partial [Xanthomonas oryzae pv. oryzae]
KQPTAAAAAACNAEREALKTVLPGVM